MGGGSISTNAAWLKFDGTTNSGTADVDVPDDHIITMISMIICNQDSSARTITGTINDGTNNIHFIVSQSIPAYGTFVFSDRFVIQGGDKVSLTASRGNVDCHYSYISQNWS